MRIGQLLRSVAFLCAFPEPLTLCPTDSENTIALAFVFQHHQDSFSAECAEKTLEEAESIGPVQTLETSERIADPQHLSFEEAAVDFDTAPFSEFVPQEVVRKPLQTQRTDGEESMAMPLVPEIVQAFSSMVPIMWDAVATGDRPKLSPDNSPVSQSQDTTGPRCELALARELGKTQVTTQEKSKTRRKRQQERRVRGQRKGARKSFWITLCQLVVAANASSTAVCSYDLCPTSRDAAGFECYSHYQRNGGAAAAEGFGTACQSEWIAASGGVEQSFGISRSLSRKRGYEDVQSNGLQSWCSKKRSSRYYNSLAQLQIGLAEIFDRHDGFVKHLIRAIDKKQVQETKGWSRQHHSRRTLTRRDWSVAFYRTPGSAV